MDREKGKRNVDFEDKGLSLNLRLRGEASEGQK
jgi:hypothetical protein